MQATNTRQVVDARTGAAAVLAAIIFAAGIALGSFMDLGLPGLGGATAVPLGDRSYDAVEETRARGFSQSVPLGDRSYDAVEETRAGGK